MRLDVTRARYPNHQHLIAQRGRGMAWFHGNGMAWFHGNPLQDGEGLGFTGMDALKAASKVGKKHLKDAAYAGLSSLPGAVARAGRMRKRPRF